MRVCTKSNSNDRDHWDTTLFKHRRLVRSRTSQLRTRHTCKTSNKLLMKCNDARLYWQDPFCIIFEGVGLKRRGALVVKSKYE